MRVTQLQPAYFETKKGFENFVILEDIETIGKEFMARTRNLIK